MAIKPGPVADFSNSMAAAMENALATEYQALKGQALPDMGEEDRRMLLVAIAQGVTRHLIDNLASIQMTVDVVQVTGEPDAPLMSSDNPSPIPVFGGGNIGTGNANVRQVNSTSNLIKSRGNPVVTALDTDGTVY